MELSTFFCFLPPHDSQSFWTSIPSRAIPMGCRATPSRQSDNDRASLGYSSLLCGPVNHRRRILLPVKEGPETSTDAVGSQPTTHRNLHDTTRYDAIPASARYLVVVLSFVCTGLVPTSSSCQSHDRKPERVASYRRPPPPPFPLLHYARACRLLFSRASKCGQRSKSKKQPRTASSQEAGARSAGYTSFIRFIVGCFVSVGNMPITREVPRDCCLATEQLELAAAMSWSCCSCFEVKVLTCFHFCRLPSLRLFPAVPDHLKSLTREVGCGRCTVSEACPARLQDLPPLTSSLTRSCSSSRGAWP